jgi:hypothetical protein
LDAGKSLGERRPSDPCGQFSPARVDYRAYCGGCCLR